MQNVLIVIFDVNSEQEFENAKFYVEGLNGTSKPNLLIWNGLEQLKEFQRKRLMSVFGKDVYGLTENKNGFFSVLRELGSSALHFLDIPELHIEGGILSKIYEFPGIKITESFFREDFDLASKRNIPSKFYIKDHHCLWKILPISKDFEMYGLDKEKKESPDGKTNKRFGMVVTFYKTNYNNYDSLKRTLKSLCLNDWYVVLATHSPVPEEIQKFCDLVIYESENVADQRKYSHGVAETSLIRKSLAALKDMGIEWTYKLCYDIELSDPKILDQWKKDLQYGFVSCKWGEKIVSTNSFFCNIDFTLENFSFFDSIEKMFEKSFFIEDIWEKDIIERNLTESIFTYQTKEEMFGTNRMDTNFFNYDDIRFRYVEEEEKFYVDNFSPNPVVGKINIVDFYSELSIYANEIYLGQGSIWIWPNPVYKQNDLPKNGYFMEITGEDGNVVLRRNLCINDFRFKHPYHKIHKTIRQGMSRFCKDTKYPELVMFKDLKIYDKFKLRERSIKTFIDAGAHAGMFTLAMIESGAGKGYLLEPEPNAFGVLNDSLQNNFLKVFKKALYKESGTVTLNIFSEHQTTNSIDPTWQPEIKESIQVESITIDDFFSSHIEEDTIDLFKIDIEGGEYDAFEGMSDETMKRCNSFLIEYHANKNMRVLALVERLVKNGFSIIFDKFNPNDTDDYLSNDMGILFAHR